MKHMQLTNLFAAVSAAGVLVGTAIPAQADWPQWRGPSRDGVATDSPRLLDAWPKDGPPLLWKSDWIPGCEEGGCGHPVVADGKVFVYANAKNPVGGGDGYRFISTNLLLEAGWLPGLPDPLARKIEAAWISTNRPGSGGWKWYNPAVTMKEGALDEFLAKHPDLDRYIREFLSTLAPDENAKYAEYIRRRLCMDTAKNKWGVPNAPSWDALVALSQRLNETHRSRREWAAALDAIAPGTGSLCDSYPDDHYWHRAFTLSDTLFCLDAATGRLLWRSDFPEERSVAVNNVNNVQWWSFESLGACSTPVIAGDRCYVSGAVGLYCLAAKDGAVLWQVRTNQPAHTQVLVVDGVVYDAGRGCAYDAATGSLRWRNPLWPQGRWPVKDDQYRWNPPLVWKHEGKNYIITTDGGVNSYCCLEPATGTLRWTLKTPVGIFAAVSGDILVVPAPYGGGGTRAFRMSLAGTEPVWVGRFGAVDGMTFHQGHLYVQDRCVEMTNGEVNWKSPLGIDSIAPPILADGKIIVQWGSSHQITKQWGGGYSIVMFRATPERFVELGRFNPHACHMCSPAFADGRLYVRLLDRIACYDLQEHGIYLDRVTASQESLAFQFRQTGGGLEGDPASLLLTDATGAATAARARIQGEEILVDVKDVAAPFSLSCTNATLKGRNGRPVPPFGWSLARQLRVRSSFSNTIVLAADRPLTADGGWNRSATYTIGGARITAAEVDPLFRTVKLTTDKAWKPGDRATLTYACYPVSQGEPRRAAIPFTAVETQQPAARFVKTDETTSGDWKGVYGSDGAVICGDKGAVLPAYAQVTVPRSSGSPWAPSVKDTRFLQSAANGGNRSVLGWAAGDQFDIEIALTDGREHQIACYGLDWGRKTLLRVEVLNGDTREELDAQSLSAHNRGKYLVWNVKGNVIIRFASAVQDEGSTAVVGGVFFDPPAAAAR